MKGRGVAIGAILVALLLAACGATATPAGQFTGKGGAPALMPTLAPAAPAPAQPGSRASELASVADDQSRMIIREASLSIIVKDTVASLDEVQRIAAQVGGYITESRTWRDGDQIRGSATLRIPASAFESALDALKKLSVKPPTWSTSGRDVTEEYVDLGARLRNLEAAEKELQALLTTVRERTGKADEILAVYRELTDIRGQIEQIQGRMQYLSRLTDLATVVVELVPEPLEKPVVQPGFNPGSILRSAARALVVTMQGIVGAVIWLVVYVVPVLVVIAIPVVVVFLLVRWAKRRAARRAQA